MKQHLHLYIYMVCFLLCRLTTVAQDNTPVIPKTSTAISIDGALSIGEWESAVSYKIPNTEFSAKLTRDTEFLYVVFTNLVDQNKISHNAEVLLQIGESSNEWNDNTYWFHSSYGNCGGKGQYYYWDDCDKNTDWKANKFPFFKNNDNIEFRISLKKIQLQENSSQQLRIAFKVSGPGEVHFYWPPSATISDPTTWGSLQF